MKLHGVINQKTTIDIVVITTTTINITTLGLLRLQRLTLFPLLLDVPSTSF
jgi:vacuolar-type H+-ATPase subunit F/Vma7